MKLKLLTMLAVVVLLFAEAEAAKSDVYRDMLSNGHFTLKYTITEPPVRVTNKEATLTETSMFGRFDMTDTSAAKTRAMTNYRGIVVCDGANKYTEYLDPINEGWIRCVLRKNNLTYRYRYATDGKKTIYMSRYGKNAVIANLEEGLGELSPRFLLNEEYSYGTSSITKALMPLTPPEKIIATPFTPEFKLIGSGTLDGGLTYDDFFGNKNGFNCAVRYYFDGDALVKIALFDYVMSEGRVQSYEKCVITVDEFSATPDQNYLQLPAELKDNTKR